MTAHPVTAPSTRSDESEFRSDACGGRRSQDGGEEQPDRRQVHGAILSEVGTVDICGDTIVAGSIRNDHACPTDAGCDSGIAYVFVKPAGGWSGTVGEVAKLTASDAQAGDRFGSVAISGQTIAFSSRQASAAGSGRIYVFERASWSGDLTENAQLTPSSLGARYFSGTMKWCASGRARIMHDPG